MTAAPEDAPSAGVGDVNTLHTLHEDRPWTESIPGHPRRSDSPEYVESRRKMNQVAQQAHGSPAGLFFGGPPFQDHHGGGLWLKDADGWFLARNLAGMEWSAQFCADPARVNLLRLNARRLYAGFPDAVDALGIRDLLDTPIVDAAGVARWTDSICNASVPLSPELHTGELPKYAGLHHYPEPVAIVATFKYADFNLWVTDEEGATHAVAPMGHRGSGDARTHVIYAEPGSKLHAEHRKHLEAGEAHVLAADHPLAQQAFAQQAPAEGVA